MRKIAGFVLVLAGVTMIFVAPHVLGQALGQTASFQKQKAVIIDAGEENPTGGTYCFSDYEAKGVNALWHVVGPYWRQALADEKNEYLREKLHGRSREFIRNGVVYYSVSKEECLFVPPPIKARVPILALIPDTNDNPPHPPPTPGFFDRGGWFERNLLWILGLVVVMTILATAMVVKLGNKRQLAEEVRIKAERDFNDPEGAGKPIIFGGMDFVPPEDQLRVAKERLCEIGAHTYSSAYPYPLSDYRVIGDVVQGTLDGTGLVEYANGKAERRKFNNTPAFRGLVEHIPSGVRVFRYALWMCANGCYRDLLEGKETFTFTPMIDSNGLRVIVAPIISATSEEISRYGSPAYDPRHDLLRQEAWEHHAPVSSRSRVYMNGVEVVDTPPTPEIPDSAHQVQ